MNLSAMDSRDFFEVISNDERDGTHLAAIMVPYIILFVAIMLGVGFIVAISGCCCFLVKERRRGQGDIEKRPNEIVVTMVCDNDKGYIV